ncbi:MAG: hypothetical protein FJ109_18450 [Deltaproteobacteria bacterium]|nr:hypothetical protein [Deltaproteobacteria bacterium]
MEAEEKGKQGRWVFRNQRWYFLPGESDVYEYRPASLDRASLALLADPQDLLNLLGAASSMTPLPFLVGVARGESTESAREGPAPIEFSDTVAPPWLHQLQQSLPAAEGALVAMLERGAAAAFDSRKPVSEKLFSSGAGILAEPFGILVEGALSCHGSVAMLDLDATRIVPAQELAYVLDLPETTAAELHAILLDRLPTAAQTAALTTLFRRAVCGFTDRLTQAFSHRSELAAEQARSRHFLVRAEALERRLLQGRQEMDQARKHSGAVAAELAAILENPGIGITIEDISCIVRYVNPMMRKTFGNVVGRKCYEAFKGRAEPCNPCPIRQIWEEGMDSVRYTTADPRSGRTFEVLTVPLVSDSGDKLVVEVGLDITHLMKEQKQGEARQLRMSERNRLYREMLTDFNEILVQLAGVLSYLMVDMPTPLGEEGSGELPLSPAVEEDRRLRIEGVLAQLSTVLDTVSWLAVASSAERSGATVDVASVTLDAIAEAMGRGPAPFPAEMAVMPPVECDAGLLRAAVASIVRSLTGGDPSRLGTLRVGHTMSGRKDGFATGDGWHVVSFSLPMEEEPIQLPGAMFDAAHVQHVVGSLLARRMGGALWRVLSDGRDNCHLSMPVSPVVE